MSAQLVAAARQLFADYEIPVEVVDTTGELPTAEPIGMAVIGYAGEGLRGALVMLTRQTAVRAWMVAAGVTASEAEEETVMDDVLAEFSNMLLGRLKALLLPEGIAIFATTPTTAWGEGLRLSTPPCRSTWSSMQGPDWTLQLRLDATFEPTFEPRADVRPLVPAQPGACIDLTGDAANVN
jgi:CheY-specific phosphatase CheX